MLEAKSLRDCEMGSGITIFTLTSARHEVDAYHHVIEALKKRIYIRAHMGISTDLWYSGNSLGAYLKYSYEGEHLPRPSGQTTSWWYSPNILQEFRESMPSLKQFILNLIDSKKPGVFLIDDDTWILEVFIIQLFNERKIPVVLLEHGPGFAYSLEVKGEILSHTIRQSMGNLLSNLKYKIMTACMGPQLPRVRSFGLNGKYLICTYSKKTREILTKHGVNPNIIRDTGFPAFDSIIKSKPFLTENHKQRTRRRVLIISSGRGRFGDKDYAVTYYKFIVKLYAILKCRYDCYLRLKPGEDLAEFLNKNVLNDLLSCGIEFDDNKVLSEVAIPEYDLIIGEPSNLLYEAILLERPVILIDSDHTSKICSPTWHFLYLIGMLTIDDRLTAYEIKEFVESAVRPDYLIGLTAKFRENADYYFNNCIDGRAGERIADVVMEIMKKDGSSTGKPTVPRKRKL